LATSVSESLSSESLSPKTLFLWKMQQRLELLRPKCSLSTVSSAHFTPPAFLSSSSFCTLRIRTRSRLVLAVCVCVCVVDAVEAVVEGAAAEDEDDDEDDAAEAEAAELLFPLSMVLEVARVYAISPEGDCFSLDSTGRLLLLAS
jgi:hypothetical protein